MKRSTGRIGRPKTWSSRDRYRDLTDRHLAAVLAGEDVAQEHGLDPHARSTCYVHRCWAHQCVSAPVHAIVVTGHRWCRRCDCAVDAVVDEIITRSVCLRCPRCGVEPDTAANRQVVSACQAGIAAMHGGQVSVLHLVAEA